MDIESRVFAPDICGITGPFKILKLLVADGSQISVGDTILELECEEAYMDIDSIDAGKASLLVEIDEVVQPKQALATITETRAPGPSTLNP